MAISPTQIRQKCESRYQDFLRSIVNEEKFFPLELPIGKLPKDYIDLRKAVTQLIDNSKQCLGYGYDLELGTIRTHSYGTQSLPKRIEIYNVRDYLKLIEKEKEFSQFTADVNSILTVIPELKPWIYRYPLKVIEYSDRWDDLLKVCQYFKLNPQPNLYIRELPIQVHTKFIEQNQKIIRELIEAIVSVEKLTSVAAEKEFVFEKRFALKYREPLIRMRILDKHLKSKLCFPASDISIPISEFRELNLSHYRCFITENLMNFITLPTLENSIVIFGSGYGIQTLKSVTWLSHCRIFYWGDLDVDGFQILSQLRSYFPQTVSLMMDKVTFEMFQKFAVSVVGEARRTLTNLTFEEENIYNYLLFNKKRLEQERISQDYVDRIILGATGIGDRILSNNDYL